MATPPDFTTGQVLTAAQMNDVGLWLIETKDVTSAATIDFTGVFNSADYQGYVLMYNYLQNTSASDLNFQFRDSGGVVTSGYRYGFGGSYQSSGTPLFAGFSFQTTDTTTGYIGSTTTAANRSSGIAQMPNPTNSAVCYVHCQASSISVSATLTNVNVQGSMTHNTSTVRTGFRLTPSAGTVTGKFSLYGYRN